MICTRLRNSILALLCMASISSAQNLFQGQPRMFTRTIHAEEMIDDSLELCTFNAGTTFLRVMIREDSTWNRSTGASVGINGGATNLISCGDFSETVPSVYGSLQSELSGGYLATAGDWKWIPGQATVRLNLIAPVTSTDGMITVFIVYLETY